MGDEYLGMHNPHPATMQQMRPIKVNQSNPVTIEVVADLVARRAMGEKKYGTELTTANGRDPLIDAYQEALDLVVYLKQAIMEREGR